MKTQISLICLSLLLVTGQTFAQAKVSLADRELTEGKIAAAEEDSSLASQIQSERIQIQSIMKEINAIHDRITAKVMDDQDASGSTEDSSGLSPMRCSGQILFVSEDVIRGLRSLKKVSSQMNLNSFRTAKVQMQKNLLDKELDTLV